MKKSLSNKCGKVSSSSSDDSLDDEDDSDFEIQSFEFSSTDSDKATAKITMVKTSKETKLNTSKKIEVKKSEPQTKVQNKNAGNANTSYATISNDQIK